MASTSKKKAVTKVAAKKKVTKKTAAPKAAAREKVTPQKTVKKKAASARKIAPKKATKKKSAKTAKTDTSMMDITPKERWKMVAVAAYHKAEKRGFAPGHELQDWIDAEKDIAEFLQDK